MIKKWHGSKVNTRVDMDDGMTNNFEIFVQGKTKTYLVHSRMKKNHKLFHEESEEHLAIVKKAINDIAAGKEPTLPESRKKGEKAISKTFEQRQAERKAAEDQKKEEAEKRKAEAKARLDAEEAEKAKEQADEEAKKKQQEATKKKLREEEAAKKKKAAAKKKAIEQKQAKAKAEKDARESTSAPDSEKVEKVDLAEADTTASTGSRSQEDTLVAAAVVDPNAATSVEATAANEEVHLKAEGETAETPESHSIAKDILQAEAKEETPLPTQPLPMRVAKEEIQAQLNERAAARTAARAEAQRTAQSNFFGFLCCRSSKLDDDLPARDLLVQQVVDA